jgi:DNA (cytosine-5)-methyltransferase 1
MLTILDLFSGIGGFSCAAERICPTGAYKTIQFVENNEYCQNVLKKNFPGIPIHGDIRSFNPIPADVATMGFPCQDLSSAGLGVGLKGKRSGLFYAGLEVIRNSGNKGCKYFILENVASAVKRALPEILKQVSLSGYDAEWACVHASHLGACHKRSRLYLLGIRKDIAAIAYADGHRKQRQGQPGTHQSVWTQENIRGLSRDYRNYSSQPLICRRNDGLPARLDRANGLLQGGKTKADIAAAGKQIRRILHELWYRQNPVAASAQGIRLTEFHMANALHQLPRENSQQNIDAERARICERLCDVWRILCGETFKTYKNMLESLLEQARQIEYIEKMGIKFREDRLRAIGNSVVPQCAAVPLKRILELEVNFSLNLGAGQC